MRSKRLPREEMKQPKIVFCGLDFVWEVGFVLPFVTTLTCCRQVLTLTSQLTWRMSSSHHCWCRYRSRSLCSPLESWRSWWWCESGNRRCTFLYLDSRALHCIVHTCRSSTPNLHYKNLPVVSRKAAYEAVGFVARLMLMCWMDVRKDWKDVDNYTLGIRRTAD